MSIWSITTERGGQDVQSGASRRSHPGRLSEAARPDGHGGRRRAGREREALSYLLNGHSGVSPDMAIRLEKAGWSTADHWLRMQMQRDLSEARQREAGIKVKPFSRPTSA